MSGDGTMLIIHIRPNSSAEYRPVFGTTTRPNMNSWIHYSEQIEYEDTISDKHSGLWMNYY